MVSRSKGKREVIVERYRKLGTPTADEKTFDAELGEEMNAWAKANVGAPEREERGSDGLQREFHRRRSKEVCSKT